MPEYGDAPMRYVEFVEAVYAAAIRTQNKFSRANGLAESDVLDDDVKPFIVDFALEILRNVKRIPG